MQRVVLALVLLAVVAALFLSCGRQEAVEPVSTSAPEPVAAAEPEAPAEAPAMVELTAEGSTFDPPVQVSQIPEGAWYCDMGTVHFARPDHGDGKCPVCGMELVQYTAEPEETSGSADEAPSVDEEHGEHEG